MRDCETAVSGFRVFCRKQDASGTRTGGASARRMATITVVPSNIECSLLSQGFLGEKGQVRRLVPWLVNPAARTLLVCYGGGLFGVTAGEALACAGREMD